MSGPQKRNPSPNHLNRVHKAWPDLTAEQQVEFTIRIEACASRQPQPNLSTEISSERRQKKEARRWPTLASFCIDVEQATRRMSRFVLGSNERGPVQVVYRVLDLMVIKLGDKPQSRSGRATRQLLAAAWIMLCVLVLSNYAQADISAELSRAWSIVYGTLGVMYLALWSILVIGIVRERRKWATQQ